MMPAEAEPGPRPSGRARTIEALHRRFEDAEGGVGGVTLLVGDTGVGKSTLVAKLVPDLRARGARVLVGRAASLDDPPPFSLLRSAFEGSPDDSDLAFAEAPRSDSERYLLGFAPRLGGANSPTPIGTEEWLLKALGVTGERVKISRDWVLAGIADQFLQFTSEGPTVLVLDDIHRADESSLSAITFLATQLQGRPLWILATSRSGTWLSDTGRSRLQEFESATRAQEIVLHPLTVAEVAAFLRESDPTRELSDGELLRRYAETGGNPLLLQKLDRRIASGDDIHGRPAGALPPLDESAQRMLEVASVLGPEFSLDLLQAASEAAPDNLRQVVDRLVDRGLLHERAGGLLEFPHDGLREETYSRLSEGDRRRLHQRTGETRESEPSEGSTRIFGLARDFYLGKVDKKSVEYNRQAAQIAESALAPDVAREFLARALESQRELDPDDREAESELVLELGRVTFDLGHLVEAEGIFRHLLEREEEDPCLPLRTRAALQLHLSRTLTARGELSAAAELARRILASPELATEKFILIGAHHQIGFVLYYGGNYSEALAHHTEELRLAREAGNEQVIAHARLWRAGDLAMMGQAKEAIAEARAVASALDRFGGPGESAQGHLFLGNMLADDKSTALIREEALLELEQAIRMGEKAQDPRRVGWALYHSAELLFGERRFIEAGERAERAFKTLGRIGDPVGQSQALKVLGQISMEQAAYELAETQLTEARRLLEGLHNTLNEIDVVLRLGQLHYARGDREAARGQVEQLERLKLAEARPDLATEFEQLKKALVVNGSGE